MENKSNFSLLHLIKFRYLPYWPVFLAFTILFIAAGYLYVSFAPKKYRSKASILIKDEKKGVDNSRMVESLNIYDSKKIVENEIEVIKSKSVLFQTVKELNLCAPLFMDDITSNVSAYSKAHLIVEVLDIEKIKESGRLDYYFDPENDSVYFQDRYFSLGQWINTSYGTIRFIKNPKISEIAEGPFYFTLVDPRKIVEELEVRLQVIPVSKLSTVVTLGLIDSDPRRGEDILNKIIEVYTNASMNEKNSLAINTMEFVEQRIRMVERQLDSVESIIQNYKSERGIVDLSEEGKLFLKNVGDNDRRHSELSIQLAVLEKVEGYVRKKNNSKGLVPSTLGISDGNLNQLVERLYEAEIKYERLSKTTPHNNLIMVTLRREIEQIRPSILEIIQNQRLNIQASLNNLNNTSRKYATALQTIPRKERELLEINRQQAIKNNVYTFLLQKREETALTYASTVGDSRVIDKASSGIKAETPRKALVYLEAVGFALLFGFLWVYYKEGVNSKILFRSDIESRTKIPIASEVFHSRLKDFIVVNNTKEKLLTEQFRQLRAAIGLYGKAQNRIIMITSSVSGEGKSFVSANFAVSLAQSNKTVCLVDFDLRNPRITNFFNCEGLPGVSDYLEAKATLNTIVRPSPYDKLSIIGAGNELDNPTEILLNGDFYSFFNELKSNYEYIIVDTAPVEPVTDAFIISPYCEATLFVIRHNKTEKLMVTSLDNENKLSILNNVSLIFNGVKSRGFLKESYGKGYGYGYGMIYKKSF